MKYMNRDSPCIAEPPVIIMAGYAKGNEICTDIQQWTKKAVPRTVYFHRLLAINSGHHTRKINFGKAVFDTKERFVKVNQ